MIIIEIENIISFLKENTDFNVSEIISISKLGGMSNQNYKILFNNNFEVFLRVCDSENSYIDRKNELQVIKILSKNKLTPKIYYFDVKSGNMILPWINGNLPKESDFSNECFMKKLCTNLKKFHSLNIEKVFNPFENIRNQIGLCKARNLTLPSYIDDLAKKIDELEFDLNKNKTMGLCHNDFNYSNIIVSEKDFYFIDFEYSAMNDIFWDFATIAWFLKIDERKKLLKYYFGDYREEDYKKLMKYLYVVKMSNALWSLIKSEKKSTKYDYLKGAFIVFEDLNNS